LDGQHLTLDFNDEKNGWGTTHGALQETPTVFMSQLFYSKPCAKNKKNIFS